MKISRVTSHISQSIPIVSDIKFHGMNYAHKLSVTQSFSVFCAMYRLTHAMYIYDGNWTDAIKDSAVIKPWQNFNKVCNSDFVMILYQPILRGSDNQRKQNVFFLFTQVQYEPTKIAILCCKTCLVGLLIRSIFRGKNCTSASATSPIPTLPRTWLKVTTRWNWKHTIKWRLHMTQDGRSALGVGGSQSIRELLRLPALIRPTLSTMDSLETTAISSPSKI